MLAVLYQLTIFTFVLLLAWAAVTDFRQFIIPNRICLAILLLYPAYAALAPVPVHWMFSLGMGVVIFLVGWLFFAIGAMGGGDAKLMAVTTPWVGPFLFLDFMVVTVIVSIALAIVVATRLSISTTMTENLGAAETAKRRFGWATVVAGLNGLKHAPLTKLSVPYGVAIAAAGIFVGVQHLTPAIR